MMYGAIRFDAGAANGKPLIGETSIPVQTLFDYLEEERSLEQFLEEYPAVNKKDVLEIMQMAKRLLSDERILREAFQHQPPRE